MPAPPSRFGVAVVLLVFAYLAWAISRSPLDPPPALRPAYPVTERDVEVAKSNLCRLARAERAFYAATGHYAEEFELRADGNPTLPASTNLPYFYRIHVPGPERLVIVAIAYGPLNNHPPAVMVDDRLQLCALRSNLPDLTWTLDHPPERWGHVSYDCETCP